MEIALEAELLRAGPLELRPAECLAALDGRPLTLTVREFDLLCALVRRSGRIVSREELYAVVWGQPFRKQERSVDVYVRKLRAKLERVEPTTEFIHTHFGFGYRLEPTPLSQLLHNEVTTA